MCDRSLTLWPEPNLPRQNPDASWNSTKRSAVVSVFSNCPLSRCMWGRFALFFFFFSSCGSDTESIAEKDSLFPVVGEETDGAHTQSKNMLTQSLSICLSARVSATGHDCHNAQVCSFNHSRLPRSRCGQHSSRDFSESVCSLVFLSHTFKKQHRGIVKYGVVSPRPCYQRADPYDGSLLDLADVCALCFPNFPEQLPNAAMRCFKLRRTNPFKAVMKKKTPSAEVCGSAPDVSR